jgi:hypothetical protein
VLGFACAPDLRDSGRPTAGALWAALGIGALIVALAGVAVGLAIVADGPFG